MLFTFALQCCKPMYLNIHISFLPSMATCSILKYSRDGKIMMCTISKSWQIRAANLSGDCAWKRELLRGHSNIQKQHQVCRYFLHGTDKSVELIFPCQVIQMRCFVHPFSKFCFDAMIHLSLSLSLKVLHGCDVQNHKKGTSEWFLTSHFQQKEGCWSIKR